MRVSALLRQLSRPLILLAVAVLLLQLTHQLLLSSMAEGIDGDARDFVMVVHKLALTLLWLSIAWLAGRLIQALLLNPVFQARVGQDAPAILASLISVILMIVTLLSVVASIWERSFGALVATSGIITLVLGLALREMITDFFSGIALNLEQPYRIGDWIQTDEELVGEVVAINWRATHLQLNDKRVIVVPNGLLARNSFINYSLPTPVFRDNLQLVFSYNIDPTRVENILMSAVISTPGLAPGAKHRVRIDEFGPRGVLFEVKYWLPSYADLIPLRHKLAVNVMNALDQAGIPLPYSSHELFKANSRPRARERRIDSYALLRRVELFSGLSGDELRHLADRARGIELGAGNQVIYEGQAGNSLYVVVEGVLSVSCDGQTVGQLSPGQFFGERSLLTGEPRMATVAMLTSGYLLDIASDDLGPLIKKRPELADSLAVNMVHHDQLNRQLAHKKERREVATEGSRANDARARILAFFHL